MPQRPARSSCWRARGPLGAAAGARPEGERRSAGGRGEDTRQSEEKGRNMKKEGVEADRATARPPEGRAEGHRSILEV